MLTFWLVALAMVATAGAIVWIPLQRTRPTHAVSRNTVNADIFRERVAELELDKQEGRLDEEQYALLRKELERTLLTDIPANQQQTNSSHAQLFRWTGIVTLGVPALALGFYYFTAYRGEARDWISVQAQFEDAVLQAINQPDALPEKSQLSDFTRVLQARVLQEGFEEPDSLYLLGRSYLELGQLQGALMVLDRAYALDSQQPQIMLAYAQAMILAHDGRLNQASTQLLQQVLQVAPDHQGALMLFGFGAFNSGSYEQAIAAWQRLLALRDPVSEGAQLLSNGIARAQALMAEQAQASTATVPLRQAPAQEPTPTPGPRIEVTVDLAPNLLEQLSPEDTLFIFAKAAEGPPMPLAAVRQPAGVFPVQVVLDDSQAMMPALKLSGFKQVIVGARISKAGSVTAQVGDLQGSSGLLELIDGMQSVALTIDQVVQ
ncbi:MAG: c-type cytochrome biogenesis protein CcmI [Candidatus Competibacteraceae bacterium]|jgi:cytochrome c-type biogenesis protein CcmH|nr:c-type cytochrome biogenesis protein CcmI [Candidatus Competibacteraceae bacterium]